MSNGPQSKQVGVHLRFCYPIRTLKRVPKPCNALNGVVYLYELPPHLEKLAMRNNSHITSSSFANFPYALRSVQPFLRVEFHTWHVGYGKIRRTFRLNWKRSLPAKFVSIPYRWRDSSFYGLKNNKDKHSQRWKHAGTKTRRFIDFSSRNLQHGQGALSRRKKQCRCPLCWNRSVAGGGSPMLKSHF